MAPRYGGPPIAARDLCRELVKKGISVSVYTTDIDGKARLDVPLFESVYLDGVEYKFFPVQSPRRYRLSLGLAFALRKDISSFDVVHIHSIYVFPSMMAAYYARSYKVPYIIRPHGTLDPVIYERHRWLKAPYEKLIEWRNLERAAAVHFTAEEEQLQAERLRLRIKGVVVPHGVSSFSIAPRFAERFYTSFPETRHKRVVLFLGRLNYKKGLDLLVEAFGSIAHSDMSLHLVLAGPDDEGLGTVIRKRLKSLGLLERCTFTGILGDEDKVGAFSAASVFALPSYGENFGMAAAEAMAAGVPTVISDRVNIWKEVAEYNAAVVIKCDPKELSRELARLITSPGLAKAMGERARLLMAEKFSWSTAANKLIDLYETLRRADQRYRYGEHGACGVFHLGDSCHRQ
jgi:glycosyltransferase involved in cell wall biosynthesis